MKFLIDSFIYCPKIIYCLNFCPCSILGASPDHAQLSRGCRECAASLCVYERQIQVLCSSYIERLAFHSALCLPPDLHNKLKVITEACVRVKALINETLLK